MITMRAAQNKDGVFEIQFWQGETRVVLESNSLPGYLFQNAVCSVGKLLSDEHPLRVSNNEDRISGVGSFSSAFDASRFAAFVAWSMNTEALAFGKDKIAFDVDPVGCEVLRNHQEANRNLLESSKNPASSIEALLDSLAKHGVFVIDADSLR